MVWCRHQKGHGGDRYKTHIELVVDPFGGSLDEKILKRLQRVCAAADYGEDSIMIQDLEANTNRYFIKT